MRLQRLPVGVALAALACTRVLAQTFVEVKLDENSIVKGVVDPYTERRSFRGIKYGEAPVGVNRWRPPRAFNWSGVYEATSYGVGFPMVSTRLTFSGSRGQLDSR